MGQERWETKYTCQCGQGVVIEQVTSYDNGYSPDDHTTSVRCDACNGRYQYKEVLCMERGTIRTATEKSTGKSLELRTLE